MKNIALLLRYDGTNYHGWQSQKNGDTIQDTVSDAITRLTGAKPLPELHGVGRTDAGVHALNYVANFLSETQIPVDRLPYALKQYLPDDISVLAATEAAPDFHARFSCLEKRYFYKIYSSRTPDPFMKHRAYFSPIPLDVPLMQKAAARVVGKHNFSCFQATGSPTKTSVRTVTQCQVETDRDGTIIISVAADGFLYNMVRIISGTLYYVGLHKLSPDDVTKMIESGDRLEAGVTLPPYGLYLERAWYPEGCFIGGELL
ncbi:MAG: tRNA pseudouridine(38-40) synthase TruA [Ruminococcaceae bacterium]|nr:tRNA pseudouridine(38-40) synthase TruA [Oscillospiraceae bacterium]